MSRPEQVSLFGELDGLFAPEMLPCTPPEEVQLVPGDYTGRETPCASCPWTFELVSGRRKGCPGRGGLICEIQVAPR